MANTTDCPGTLNCPALPRVSLDQAVIDLLESIALQESALSHILCAESQKMKTAMGMEELDLCKLLEVNDSATNMVHAVANLEMMLKDKLEFLSVPCWPGRAFLRSGRPRWAEMHRIMYKIQKNDLLELLRSEICVILYSVYIK